MGAIGSWLSLAAVLVWVGCQRPMPEADAGAARSLVPGCWQVEVVAGGAADSTPSELVGASLPVLRLDTVRVEAGPEAGEHGPVFRADSYHGTRRESHPFSAWRRLAADSVLVYRPGALTGYTLRLVRDDGGFEGVLTSFTDAMEPGQPTRRTAPVRATPAGCPGESSTAGSSGAS